MPFIRSKSDPDQKTKVPDTEYAVLAALAALSQESSGPTIARATNGAVTIDAIYTLLKRLEKRGLVQRREEMVPVVDIQTRRVVYRLDDDVVWPGSVL